MATETRLLYMTATIDDGSGQLGPVQPVGLGAQSTVMVWVKNTGSAAVTLTPWGWGPDAAADSSLADGVEWGSGQDKEIAAGAIDVWTYGDNTIPEFVGFSTTCSGGTTVELWIQGRVGV